MHRANPSERFMGITTAVMAATLCWQFAARPLAAQSYGLEARPPIQPFLNHSLPSDQPEPGNWLVAPAFPHLRFTNPVGLVPEPASNRLCVHQREGIIYAFDNDPDAREKEVFLDISARTQGWDDCGVLGMAFHPEFGRSDSTNRGYVYVSYQYRSNPIPGPERPPEKTSGYNRLSRFTVPDGARAANPDSELVLIDQYDRSAWHNGGAMFFHPDDGFLYLSLGDEGGVGSEFDNAQRIDRGLFSGVIRIDVNQNPAKSHPIRRQPASQPSSRTALYSIPNDNPFLDDAGEIYLCQMGPNGQIFKLARPEPAIAPPSRLSETGAFASLETLEAAPGLIPFEIYSPLWSDAAVKARWIALPNDGPPYDSSERAAFAPVGPWSFPDGTVFVKHLYSETYTFHTLSDDGVRLWIDGVLIIDNWTDHAPTEDYGSIALVGGITYPLRLEYYENAGGATIQLFWSSPNQPLQIIPSTRLSTLADPVIPSPAPWLRLVPSAGDPMRLVIDAEVAADYSVEACDDLRQWTELHRFFNRVGMFEFTDPQAPDQPWRFYRLREGP